MDKADLFLKAMRVFVRLQAAKRFAALGGTLPDMAEIPRRRVGTTVGRSPKIF